MENLVDAAPAPDAAPAQPPARERGTGSRIAAVVGELMIIAGVLLALYVVWELFYTDVAANKTQTEVVANLDWAYTAPVVAPDAPADAPQAIADEFKFDPSSAPVMDEPAVGTTFATFYVPRWGADYVKPISEGVDRHRILDTLGIGHYPRTGMPGELGNFAISAHRTTYGKPFNRIAELKIGDYLAVQTEDTWYVYRVTSHQIVRPTQVEVISPVPGQPGAEPNGHYITLTSCHPMYSAAQRYVVHGELVYWSPTDAGVPAELLETAS